jgi:aspartate carbamoyltransferase catalytic subunit
MTETVFPTGTAPTALGQTSAEGRHLLSVADLGADGIAEILRLTDSFVEVSSRPIPRVPALRGKTVVSLFLEDSTRTRLSFETAARRLSADVMTFSVASSSVNKGESLRDTVQTIEAMGIDAVVVRHRASGVPLQISRWLHGPSVINGGDGWHEHPTQALLDCYTILTEGIGAKGIGASEVPAPRSSVGRTHGGRRLLRDNPAWQQPAESLLSGVHIAIVGDVRHSRVARSDVAAFSALGADITLVAPPTLLPPSLVGWPVRVSFDLDSVLPEVDVVYLLRLQNERMTEALLPSAREYTSLYGLTRERARLLPDATLIMHPGPVNRGVEIDADVADFRSVITHQVANGVAVRMAVLYLLLGPGVDIASA